MPISGIFHSICFKQIYSDFSFTNMKLVVENLSYHGTKTCIDYCNISSIKRNISVHIWGMSIFKWMKIIAKSTVMFDIKRYPTGLSVWMYEKLVMCRSSSDNNNKKRRNSSAAENKKGIEFFYKKPQKIWSDSELLPLIKYYIYEYEQCVMRVYECICKRGNFIWAKRKDT